MVDESKKLLFSMLLLLLSLATFILKCIDGNELISQYSRNGTVKGKDQISDLFSGVIFMMYNGLKIGCDLPYSDWFINQVTYWDF
jgi:hypothetical protein